MHDAASSTPAPAPAPGAPVGADQPAASPRRRLGTRARVAIAAGLVACTTAIGGVAWALDRFVVEHVEVVSASSLERAAGTAAVAAEAGTASATVTTETVGEGDDAAAVTTAILELDDITQLRSAFADDAFGENITELPSVIAEQVGASIAINGDYYGFRDTGIVIRNGVLYRDEGVREALVLYRDGTAAIVDETATSGEELLADGAWQTLSFGPALVEDGAVVGGIESVEVDTNVGNHSIQGDQPRTAVAVLEDGRIALVVVDGRSDESAGMTLTELASSLQGLGADVAYNLDGGGSSTIVVDGEVVNEPSNGGERATSDILYVVG
ncbi:phosphodiester glycosidase family protein [Agrococcus sp. SL85]|uniref:phosphodiester glycosidase family protein n=1 Tax=Agrococcus sp. SL85 TaxID=2995141 RepID=UPI00226CB9F3|nr:phosphodiester glycosidase family protein [Agrococcus sp. SL85]WAC66334.1 phosphodiester glycosidase family protein [Agrococcus sp. SL85]